MNKIKVFLDLIMYYFDFMIYCFYLIQQKKFPWQSIKYKIRETIRNRRLPERWVY